MNIWGVQFKKAKRERKWAMNKWASKIGQIIAPSEKSEIHDDQGHTVTVESTSNGGTRLDVGELVSSGPVREFVDAVRKQQADNNR